MFLTTSASELPSSPTWSLMHARTTGGKPTGNLGFFPMDESHMAHLFINITIHIRFIYDSYRIHIRFIYDSHVNHPNIKNEINNIHTIIDSYFSSQKNFKKNS
jgi:hypothetical protein